ncbi:PIN domain-containing protein, partial [Prevotella sp. P2-180]|uniref:PIN domain-containing protein n=1 Tax=Prevotella sp. P2-180 TaxID=2024224 RepID=UPI000BC6895D
NSKVAANIVNAILSRDNILFINPVYRFKLIESDPDDNKFVDCAIHSNAKYIVSQDKHFGILRDIDFPKQDRLRIACKAV